MKLNVEIATKSVYYEDRLRRRMKRAITQTVNDVLSEPDFTDHELTSLRLVVPTARRKRRA